MAQFKLFLECDQCGQHTTKIVNYYKEVPPAEEELDLSDVPCHVCGCRDYRQTRSKTV